MLYDSPRAVKPFFRESHCVWLRVSKTVICPWSRPHYLGFSSPAGEDINCPFDEHVAEDTEIRKKASCHRSHSGYICPATQNNRYELGAGAVSVLLRPHVVVAG